MFGLAARRRPKEGDKESGSTPILGLVDYVEHPVHLDEEPEEKGVIVFLGERLSPRPISARDRWVIVAMAASLLLHVAIVALLPATHKWALAAEQARVARAEQDDRIPPVYLLPYLPKQRTEKPSTDRAPLSDMSRRAHGGEGQPDLRPGMRGNTFEPRLEPPGGERGMAAGAPRPGPGGDPGRGGAGREPGRAAEERERIAALGDKGEAAILQVPKASSGQPEGGGAPVLRGLDQVGHGGSGAVPDRRGGQVDIGPLSFDTQWYDWGPYAAEMLRRIRYHWIIPEIAQLGVQGAVRVRFFIERTGRVSGVTVERESGHPSMDFSARDAIVNASPLPPLPGDLTGVEREGVTITFYYNTRPPNEE